MAAETKTKKEGAIRSLTRQGNHLVRQTCIAAFGCAPCKLDRRGVWICGTSLCDVVDLLVLAVTISGCGPSSEINRFFEKSIIFL